MGARGQALKDRKVSSKGRRVPRSNGRGPIAGHTVRADEATDVSERKRLDEDEAGAGLDQRASGLRELDSSIESTRDKIYSRLRLKAEAALEKLIEAPGVPPNVRASAVRTALELVGAIGSRSKDQRDQEDRADELDPERLSVEDIDREINKLGRV